MSSSVTNLNTLWERRRGAPPQVKALGRRLSHQLGVVTASSRATPDFILAGAQRCGTTSLFRDLEAHPNVMSPNLHKGVNYFDINYGKGPNWYRGHFPTVRSVARRSEAAKSPATVFEASGYYVFHPLAAGRIARDLPDVKVIVMLRDPVERAWSAYRHEVARGFEAESFERALDLEPERTAGEAARLLQEPGYVSYNHRHYAYVQRGEYVDQISRLYDALGSERVHVVESESYLREPEQSYRGLLDFLGLPEWYPPSFKHLNGYDATSSIPAHLARRLQDHYVAFDERLADLLGRPAAWHL